MASKSLMGANELLTFQRFWRKIGRISRNPQKSVKVPQFYADMDMSGRQAAARHKETAGIMVGHP
jgi:hypothetical protein